MIVSLIAGSVLLGIVTAVAGSVLERPAEFAGDATGMVPEWAAGTGGSGVSPGPTRAGGHQPWGSAPVATGFPDAATTGVPAGTRLTRYIGSCTITANNTVIDGKILDCDLVIRARNVVVKRSRISGQVNTSEDTPYSYTLEDSEVDAGVVQGAAVGSTNFTVIRADIHGGATSIYCNSNCTIRDSYLHGQRLPDKANWHLGAFLANDSGHGPAARTNALLMHNTIHCDAQPDIDHGGGCSGDVNLFGDFGRVNYVTVDNNLMAANPTGISYCVYGGSSATKPYQPDHVVIVNNVFQRGANGKCGAYGPVGSFDTARPGNRWGNNVWDDGSPVPPEN